ncbi:rhamnogalacturonidase [Sphingobium sp. RAC03]|uniref:rhamnogalacturonidase n=1 Tax=Sphingobium sp. RAC03 TaxID=1843368 RepID=UPI00083E179B|nr:right-handed parallel beta-helix repeat-containing protein [Sphingobium sp. RAC03]AOF94932.1 right handed beta helix region family protein [Sphingobium sp. RAC03]
MTRRDLALGLASLPLAALPFPAHAARRFDVRDHGARGDGIAIDSDAINAAIEAASCNGGGTVLLTRGRYLCFSIRLRSRVTLLLAEGAVIEAADPARHGGRYDLPEEGIDQLYQDFGHSHWHNSLIWGDDVREVAILGPGGIDGAGLTRDGPGARWKRQAGERPLSMRAMTQAQIDDLEPTAAAMAGKGNKAIAFKNGRDIRLSGFTIRKGGHFAILATGTQKLRIDGLTIDTDRDGIDLDCVRDVVVERCRVNSPNDDAIVIKSSHALGRAIAAEDILIRDCDVSGYDMGSLIDGTRTTRQQIAPDQDRVTGRIKLGTESNGGYRNIRIEDCRFTRCRGLALETVDGGVMEHIVAHRLTMRDVTTAPLFLRLGDRRRGPEGTGIGAIRHVEISEVDARGIDHRFPATIAGLPGHPIRDVTLRDIHLDYEGGGTAQDAARRPGELADAYPEPSMFGVLPAWALWARHAERLTIERFSAATRSPDQRPPLLFDDVRHLTVRNTPLWR